MLVAPFPKQFCQFQSTTLLGEQSRSRVLFFPEFLGVAFDLLRAVGELFNVTVFVTDVDGRGQALLKATDVYLLDLQVGTEGVGIHVEAELFVFELFRVELSV